MRIGRGGGERFPKGRRAANGVLVVRKNGRAVRKVADIEFDDIRAAFRARDNRFYTILFGFVPLQPVCAVTVKPAGKTAARAAL